MKGGTQVNLQLLVILVLLASSIRCSAQTPMASNADFYVSPAGSDSWSGTLTEPNIQETDGPFATLERARDAVRDLKKNTAKDIKVLLREGTYQLNETVVFGLEDSGEGTSTITYAAYPRETPIFSAGKKIEGWKKVTEVLPGLPKAANGNILVTNTSSRFLTLYDDEGMLPRARSERHKPQKGSKKNKLLFSGTQLKSWPNVTDVEIMVRPTRDWIVNMLPLASVDEINGIARTTINATYGMNKHGFWVENVLEELNEPGEWVLNTKEGKVYLWPRNESPVFAPQLLELIRVEGKINKKKAKDIPVRNLQFIGLTFKHGERYTLSENDAGLQHDWDMLDKDNAMFRLRGAENCKIEKCHFLHGGSGAIRVDLHGINNKITGNHIEHLGGGGILLCGYGPGTKDVNKNNLVSNNHIHHVGEIYWHSPGIFLWQSGENRVANNLIHDTNYSGLIISGCVIRFFAKSGNNREQVRTIRWKEVGKLPKELTQEAIRPYMHSRGNIIEYNEIHHVMKKLGDGNGIYIRAAGPDNIIRRNYVHHLVAKTPKQGAIRTDGGQMNTLITENLIYKCKSQGMTLKRNNRFENNIITDVIVPRGVYLKIVEGPMNGGSNKRNIYYSSSDVRTFISQPSLGKDKKFGEDKRGRVAARMKDLDSDLNIYYSKTDNKKAKETLESLQSKDGVDANSVATDPMFVDPENGNFRFKPESPALKMGIVPFDMSKVGLKKGN